MIIHVLLYNSGKDNEGIHSIELKGETIVLMFEDLDDAIRYSGLLEAQDFPQPDVETIEKEEIEEFCNSAGYETRLVPRGFVPKTAEDRLLISPPVSSKDVTSWQKEDSVSDNSYNKESQDKNQELESIKKRLENLI